MKNKNTYQFTKYYIYILLIGQLGSTVFSYVNLYFDDSTSSIELVSSESDFENEEESTKNMETKMEFFNFEIALYSSKLSNDFIHTEDLFSINYLEINSPPPKQISFFS